MLIIAQKVKPNKIKLYRWAFDEIESYSLLKISSEEAHLLIDADKEGWKNEIVHGINEYVREVTPAVDEVWLHLVALHKLNNPDFTDVSKKYNLFIEGTSCLIRDPNTHTIRIAYRKKDQKCNINLLNIDNNHREEFFKDAKTSQMFRKEGKYAISIDDSLLYNKWSKYMNSTYLGLTARI